MNAPPHDLDAEESLLGSMLMAPSARDAARAAGITAAAFYKPAHGAVFAAILDAAAAGGVDIVTVAARLNGSTSGDGRKRLAEIQAATPASMNAAAYAATVRAMARRRELLALSFDIGEAARAGDDVRPLLERLSALDAQRENRLRGLLLRGAAALNDLPRPEPLVDGMLDRDSTAVVFAPWGAGKTVLATDLGLSVATGRHWHGRPVHAGRVLYVIAEGAAGQAAKLDAWLAHHDMLADPVAELVTLPAAVNLFTDEHLELVDIVADLKPALVIIDTLSRCIVGADENSARDMGIVVEHLDALRHASGACVLAVHHAGKNLDAGLRGSSVLAGAMDTALRLDNSDGLLELVEEKQKYRASGRVTRFRLRPTRDALVIDDHDGAFDPARLPASATEMLRALSELDLGNGVSASTWESGTNTPRRTFYRYVKTLAQIGLSANVGTDHRPRWTLTESGIAALECHSATPVPNGATAPAERLVPQCHHPYGVAPVALTAPRADESEVF